jgi:hypothetical protein
MKKKSLLLTAVATLGLAAATMAQNVPNYVPTNGLVGWWPFNGNANDESGNGNNGQSVNILYASDRFGNSNASANFPNGNTNSEILIGNQINLQQFSISVWIRPTGQRGYDFHTVLTKIDQTVPLLPQNNFDIQTYMPDISNKIYATLGGNNTWQTSDFGNNSVVQNQWNQIILTFDGITSRTYFNSVLINSLNIINYYNPVSTLSFGNRPNTQSIEEFNWWGDLDDIGIWNRALTQQEINDLYNSCQLAVNSQPTNQTININNNAQFVVGTSDTNATYQWQTDLGLGFQNVSNAGQYSGTTNDTLSVSNVSMSNNNQQFRCITSAGSCKDTSKFAVLSINNNVGINETAPHNLFSVFPNPVHNVINVKADHKLIGSVFTIYDNTGKAVQSGKLNAANTSIELSNLSSGFYMFSVGENRKQSFKIIKE